MIRRHVFIAATFAFAVFDAGLAPAARGQIALQPVVLTGRPAPGLAADRTFQSLAGRQPAFAGVMVNARGQVLVLAAYSDGNKGTGQGLWLGPPGGLRRVVCVGDKLPGAEPLEVVALQSPHLNEAGDVVFQANVKSARKTLRTIWFVRQEKFFPVAIEGEPAPGVADAVYSERLSCVAVGPTGTLVLVDDSPKTAGVWLGLPGQMALVARAGMPAPGAGDGVVFERFGKPRMSNAGHVVFAARLRGKGVTERSDSGIWCGQPGRIELLASEGEVAPGAEVRFADLAQIGGEQASDLAVNGNGLVAFRAAGGIWVGTPGRLQPAGAERAGAAGAKQPRLTFDGRSGLALTNDDRLVVWSSSAIWTGPAGELRPVLRKGDAAPGVSHAVFESFADVWPTAAGRVAVLATLPKGAGRGIWAGPPEGLQLIVLEGAGVTLAPNDTRAITPGSLTLAAGLTPADRHANAPSNDHGYVVCRMAFEAERGVRDRSEGVFLAKLGG